MRLPKRRKVVSALTVVRAAPAVSYLDVPTALAAESYGIEEIVVRAQRREETIQDVPIAVSAFDTDAIDVFLNEPRLYGLTLGVSL